MVPEDQAATPFDLLVEDPDEGAVHLFWADRKRARLSIPKPRLLTPVPEQGDSTDEDAGSLLIEGENRQAMVSLLAQYREKVDVVLIDPPYNTGRRDLRYDDARFEDPDADVAKGDFVSAEDGGKHAKWLNQMAPTLRVIRDLMAPHGVILIHIDDRELPRLLLLMEEIFREPNRIGTIIWKNATENNPTQVAVEHEYIVVWAKNKPKVPRVWVGPAAETRDLMLARYAEMKADGLSDAGIEKAWKKFVARHKEEIGEFVHYNKVDEHGPYTGMRALHKPEKGGYFYAIEHPVTKKPVTIPMRGYRFPEPRLREMIDQGRIIFGSDETQLLQLKVRLEEADVALRSVIHLDGRAGSNDIERLWVAGRELLAGLALPVPWATTLSTSLRMVDRLGAEIDACERDLRRLGADHPSIPLLLTIPGIGPVLAYTIASEIGDIGRFPSPKKLTGYTGLCPLVRQSGNRDVRGPLAKNGPKYLRWALIEAVTHAARDARYRERYDRTKRRLGRQRGAKVARVDIARKLAEAIWHVLTKNEPFAPAGPTMLLVA